MAVRAAERRRDIRVSAAYPASVYDLRGRLLCRGRTSNISEHGAMVVGRFPANLPDVVDLELELPPMSTTAVERGHPRKVAYRCRRVRRMQLGQLAGVGLELIEKLDT